MCLLFILETDQEKVLDWSKISMNIKNYSLCSHRIMLALFSDSYSTKVRMLELIWN